MRETIKFVSRLALVCTAVAFASPVTSQVQTDLMEFKGDTPQSFADPSAAVKEFADLLKARNIEGVAALLGLKVAALRDSTEAMVSFDVIREGAAKQLRLQDVNEYKVITVGEILWPLPFPLAKQTDGKWSFDTEVGLQEIVNRRIGENELLTIETMRNYVDAQHEYAWIDADGDLVFEFAQRLISTPGRHDGLYWQATGDEEESPAGPMLELAAFSKAKRGEGYFGYRYRILTAQGPNVKGGEHSYLVDGNMTKGHALIAWPVAYGVTGVQTFVINDSGIVYEADLGEQTERKAAQIQWFNPDQNWNITED
ncbi:DUF2950 family protein [Agrobacterium pusense]|uniref:DUF2950 family protein n=1 Tax=Agrobacterium pusense TaxID=648995 RepID=UPI00087F32C5|nr:DUF2950 family protein [Agrobacterium pusense]OOO15789.1 hypothetical protein BTE56_23025 [Agrobacterium pusense]WKD48040.1 DUF2950 domain-containing protein [Agrobacterium pusense]SDF46969.1 Protein of unknown function [Agrobacterium pusense]